MGIVETIPETQATGKTAEIYAQDRDALGYVPSHTKVLSLNPEAFAAWRALQGAIAGSMDMRRFELVTLAAALGIGSRHCRLAHGSKAKRFFDEGELVRIARDYHDAGLSEAEVAMMDFAQKLSSDSAAMTDADTLLLRGAGFSDREIVDIALAAAARNYLSRALQALVVDVDVPPGLSETLRQALLDPLNTRESVAG
ncbi:carboxymuconolactone decarboxylase [Arthrobacter livingstonensis]|uniref:Carboxymuconolactone decarboxylase n=1 Tax=Arthrobacter livingstonensis TaxID=670078 RepID=A0A2V5L5A7_9MICC|nr:carboxymuconolactone decarboxylase family protein [Arthrobacter livingstonensis]PYI66681.1 carboxymuconolactone decarboxylase [Arthrobacter livingstonensis]